MSDALDIRPVLAAVYESRGIDFSQYKSATLCRRVERRLRACNCCDIDSYLIHLRSSPDEIDKLISDLTIKYSEFFRDSWVYDAIRETVLPAIISENLKKGSNLNIWSAGCANGEEAYSLAVLVKQVSSSKNCSIDARIINPGKPPALPGDS